MVEPGTHGNRTIEATEMIAPDGERVRFVERNVVVDGPVELWLLEVERLMKIALQKNLVDTISEGRMKDKGAAVTNLPLYCYRCIMFHRFAITICSQVDN